MVHNQTGVVDVNDGVLFDGRVVAAAVAIDDRATHHLKVRLVQVGRSERRFSLVDGFLNNRCCVEFVASFIDCICHFTVAVGCLLCVEVAVAATKELTDINLLCIEGRHRRCLHVKDALTVSSIVLASSCNLFSCVIDGFTCCLRADANIAVKGAVNSVLSKIVGIGCPFLDLCQFGRYLFAYSSCRTNGSCDVVACKHLIDNDITSSVFAVDVDEGVAPHIGHAGTAEYFSSGRCHGAFGQSVDGCADVAVQHCHAGTAFHLAFVATTIDVAANLHLGRESQRHQQQQQSQQLPAGNVGMHLSYYGRFNCQFLNSLLVLPMGCPGRVQTARRGTLAEWSCKLYIVVLVQLDPVPISGLSVRWCS